MAEKKKKNFSIYFLQEVHSTRETEICWQSEWGYPTIFTNFSSSRAGVGILFNNNFYFQILKYFVDPEERFIIADIKIQDKTLTLVNIYAPNKDEPTVLCKSNANVFHRNSRLFLAFRRENIEFSMQANLQRKVTIIRDAYCFQLREFSNNNLLGMKIDFEFMS